MNNKIIYALTTSIGFGVGFLVSNTIIKKRLKEEYEALAKKMQKETEEYYKKKSDELIKSVKEYERDKSRPAGKKDMVEDEDTDDTPDPQPSLHDNITKLRDNHQKLIEDLPHTNYSNYVGSAETDTVFQNELIDFDGEPLIFNGHISPDSKIYPISEGAFRHDIGASKAYTYFVHDLLLADENDVSVTMDLTSVPLVLLTYVIENIGATPGNNTIFLRNEYEDIDLEIEISEEHYGELFE